MRNLVLFIVVSVATIMLGGAGHAQVGSGATALTEYEIKASYLYNFVKFVGWPEAGINQGAAELNLCVLGEDPFGAALDSLEGQIVKGRTFSVRRLSRFRAADSCQVLFVSSSERPRLAKILEELRAAATLSVSDIEGFAERGGTINFLIRNNRIRFAINPEAADRSGLSISSKLLKLSTIVKQRQE
jgi:hypothetical protein